MERALKAAYGATVILVVRRPNSEHGRRYPLVWLSCPDYPVPMRGKAPSATWR